MTEVNDSLQRKGLPDVMPGPSTTATPATSIFESRRLSIGRPRPPVPPGESSQRRTGSIDGVRSAAASRAGLAGLGGLQHVASLSRSGAPAAQGVGLPKDFPALIEHLSRAAGSAAGNGTYAGAPNGLYNAPAAPVINLTGGGGGGRRGAMSHGGSSVTQGQSSGPTPPRYRPGGKGMGHKVQSFDNVGLALARSHLPTADGDDMQGGASDPWGAAHVHSGGSCHGARPPSGLYTLASHPSNGSMVGGGAQGASGESSARNSAAAPPSAGGRHTSSVYAFSPRGQLGWGTNYAPPAASKLCADSNDPQSNSGARKLTSGGSSANSAIPPFGGEGYAYDAASDDAGPGQDFVGQGVAITFVAPSPLDSVDGVTTPGLIHLASPRGGYPYSSAGPGRSTAQNTAGSTASGWSAAPASSAAASTPAHSQGLGHVGGAARRGSDKPSRFRTSNMGQALATAATGAALPPSPAGGAVSAAATVRRSAKTAAAPKAAGCFGFLFGFRR